MTGTTTDNLGKINKTVCSYLKESKVYNVPNPDSTSGHVAKQAQVAQPVSYIK